MTSWFRSWHGAPTDTKWRTVAKRAGVPFGYVTAIVWVLLDRASQADQRGSIEGYDAEEIADTLGFDVEEIEAVIRALHDKEVLQDNVFSGWSTHQPAREDSSAERVRRHREKRQGNASKRDVTQCNAPKRPREDTDTDTDTDTEAEEDDSAASAASSSSRYAFEHGVIRLLPKDLEKWREAYPMLHLEAELYQLSEWAERDHPKNWFHAVSAALAKRNRQQAAAMEKARAEGAARGSPKRNLTDAAIDINRWIKPDAEPDTSRDQYALPSPDRW